MRVCVSVHVYVYAIRCTNYDFTNITKFLKTITTCRLRANTAHRHGQHNFLIGSIVQNDVYYYLLAITLF